MVNPIGGVMIETKAEYFIAQTIRPKSMKCPDCQHVFGREIRGGEFLLVGNILMERFWGICGFCGHSLIWSKSDRLMKNITRVARQR